MMRPWSGGHYPRDRSRGRPKRKVNDNNIEQRRRQKEQQHDKSLSPQTSSSSSSSSCWGSRIRLKNPSTKSHSSISSSLPPSFWTRTIHLLGQWGAPRYLHLLKQIFHFIHINAGAGTNQAWPLLSIQQLCPLRRKYVIGLSIGR